MSKNISYLSGRKGLDENLFEKMGQAAEAVGTPELNELENLREEFLVGKSTVYGATTFYDFLRPENKGKKVYVCNGTACLTAGTQSKVKQTLRNHFSANEIGEMCCLGRCHENAAFHLNGKNFSGQDLEVLPAILDRKTETREQWQVSSHGTAILTAKQKSQDELYASMRRWFSLDPLTLLNEFKTASLRGRGGAGFPIGFKLESCRNEPSDVKFIVCNADEGDPGAFSDRYILEQRPYLLLAGMMLAGYVTGANRGVVYIRGEYPESVSCIDAAVKQLRTDAWLGQDIQGSGFSFEFKVIKAQGAYICGEETALLSSIEGQRPEVRVRPPYPTQMGLFNKPTVVNNVETLANLPFIADSGGQAYASLGTDRSKGTKLVCLDGHFNRPGLVEVEMGTPLRTVIDEFGKGFRKPIKAMHIGGPLGGLVPASKIDELTIDFDSFSKAGFLLGHASIVCIPEEYPLIDYLGHLFEFTAHESCGKCFPCRLGSTRGKEMIQQAKAGNYKMPKELFTDLLEALESGSLCALGGGLPLPVKNALMYFNDELSPYFD
ncbi:MAG: NADH-ubiquinone oxidoreductase-F iron-sulfur binding region domain-containing protein [Bacteroidota bacterium]